MKDLETKNLKIRKYRMEDAKDVFENLATEENLIDCFGYHMHQNLSETKKMIYSFIQEYEMGELVWAIEEKASCKVIGLIRALEVSKNNRRCEIRFGIGFKWISSNFLEEALQRVLLYLFQEEKYHIVITKFYDGHRELTEIRSNALEKVGMKKEAILPDRILNSKTGKFENEYMYSIREEQSKMIS